MSNDWTPEIERLLQSWSEKASGWRWLHSRSEKKFKFQYYSFSIPIIILSTLSGVANAGVDSFIKPEQKSLVSAIIGGVNIFCGILGTLQTFLKVSELYEAHRIASISWGKFCRNISIELKLHPEKRTIAIDFLKISRAEYDRLIEQSPTITDTIIKQFNKKFDGKYEISMPSVVNGLEHCEIYKKELGELEYIDGPIPAP